MKQLLLVCQVAKMQVPAVILLWIITSYQNLHSFNRKCTIMLLGVAPTALTDHKGLHKLNKKTQSQREHDLRHMLVPATLAVSGFLSSCPWVCGGWWNRAYVPPSMCHQDVVVTVIVVTVVNLNNSCEKNLQTSQMSRHCRRDGARWTETFWIANTDN